MSSDVVAEFQEAWESVPAPPPPPRDWPDLAAEAKDEPPADIEKGFENRGLLVWVCGGSDVEDSAEYPLRVFVSGGGGEARGGSGSRVGGGGQQVC